MFVLRLERRPTRSWEEPHSVLEPTIVLGRKTCGHCSRSHRELGTVGPYLNLSPFWSFEPEGARCVPNSV